MNPTTLAGIQFAGTHDFPNDDLSKCGPENGWPPRLFGKVRSEKLIGVGIKTFTRLRAVVRSMTKAQFYEAYGTHDGFVGALHTGANTMWEVVTAWEFAHALKEVEPKGPTSKTTTDAWLMHADSHRMPDEDLKLGQGGGWPRGAMGDARVEKLKALGITRTSQLMMQALSMSSSKSPSPLSFTDHLTGRHVLVADGKLQTPAQLRAQIKRPLQIMKADARLFAQRSPLFKHRRQQALPPLGCVVAECSPCGRVRLMLRCVAFACQRLATAPAHMHATFMSWSWAEVVMERVTRDRVRRVQVRLQRSACCAVRCACRALCV